MNKNIIDVYAVYCPNTDECYYFDPNEFNRAMVLRVTEPISNQRVGINFASDYREVPFLL